MYGRITKRSLLLALAVLASLAAPAHSHESLPSAMCAPPSSPPPAGQVVRSPNVDYLGTIPGEAGSLDPGGRIVGHYFYVTGSDHFSIYDVQDPVHPKLMSRVDFPCRFENEDVATNGRVLIYTDFATTGDLYVYDVQDKSHPKLLADVPGAGTHTMACIDDCRYLYGSYHLATTVGPLRTGEVVDLRDPSHPVVLGDWTANGVLPSRDVHWQYEVTPGRVLTSSAPIEYLDVSPETAPSLVHPKVLAQSDTGSAHADRWHTAIWPRAGQDRFLLASLETNATPNCALGVGAFRVFDTTGWETTHKFTTLDSYYLQNGTYFNGNPPANVLGCSPHWFNVRPSWHDGGVVALATYDNGTQFLRVDPNGRIHEIGYALPPGTEASATYWATCDIVYTADYTRGVDIFRLNDPQSACPAERSGGRSLLPRHRRCVARRRLTLALRRPRGARIVDVRVFIDGKRRLHRRGHNIRRLTLHHLPRKTFVVRIVARESSGKRLVSRRRYRPCRTHR